MSTVDEFGIIPVARGIDGKLLVQKEVVFPTKDDALRAGTIFAQVLGGAVAFRRRIDTEAGVKEDGIIIGRYGILAEEKRDAK